MLNKIKNFKRIIISFIIGGSALAMGATTFIEEPAITLNNPQKIEWIKPLTDAEWAEDVKKENFDIKSTEVLQEMKLNHTDKLQKVIDNNKRIAECSECIKYELKTIHPDWTQTDIDNEYISQLSQYQWDVEKLQQSIERMDNELRLRNAKFVIPDKNKDGIKTSESELKKVKPEYIRKIND